MDNNIYYDECSVVFQEIPNEISLAFTLKGCPNNCEGCHSPHLRELGGRILNKESLQNILDKYKNSITCVLFLGGDRWHNEISKLCKVIHDNNLKTAMYSGNDILDDILIRNLDYYKIGAYKEEFGGLNNKNTNQRLYKIENITKEFWNWTMRKSGEMCLIMKGYTK